MPLAFPKEPPPGPSRPEFWRSPIRGPLLTSVLGVLLLIGFPIVFLTGLFSHAAYMPQLGDNAVVPSEYWLQPLQLDWPTGPSWLYALNQGTHITLGIVLVPVVLGKLWAVIPKLFSWPPVKSPAHALERLAALVLVGSTIFQLATGILNTQLWYPWGFNFVIAHYYGAWILIASIVVHVLLRLGTLRQALATRKALEPLFDSLQDTKPEPPDEHGLATPNPAEPTISRRGAIGLVGASSAGLFVVTAGQSIGGPLRDLAVLAPRGDSAINSGPNGFPVNKTAATAKVRPAMVDSSWRLKLVGPAKTLELSRQELLDMQLATYEMPIACVEGWSSTQSWTGVRLAELGRLCGVDGAEHLLRVESLQPKGAFRQVTLSNDQMRNRQALLALRVNDADISLDHGYPARIIVPAMPGVHCTKWVSELRFKKA